MGADVGTGVVQTTSVAPTKALDLDQRCAVSATTKHTDMIKAEEDCEG